MTQSGTRILVLDFWPILYMTSSQDPCPLAICRPISWVLLPPSLPLSLFTFLPAAQTAFGLSVTRVAVTANPKGTVPAPPPPPPSVSHPASPLLLPVPSLPASRATVQPTFVGVPAHGNRCTAVAAGTAAAVTAAGSAASLSGEAPAAGAPSVWARRRSASAISSTVCAETAGSLTSAGSWHRRRTSSCSCALTKRPPQQATMPHDHHVTMRVPSFVPLKPAAR